MLLSLLGACTPQDGGPLVDVSQTPASPTVVTPPSLAGTFVLDHDVRISIPEGAALEPFTLTVERVPEGVPAPYVELSDYFVFSPADITFESPITVTIPYHPPDVEARVFYAEPSGELRQLDNVRFQDGYASFQVTTLTSGFVAEPVRSVEIPVDGGTFTFDGGVELWFAPGAVAEPTTVTLEESSALPDRYVGHSPAVDFIPSNLMFHAPVTLTLPYTGASDDLLLYVPNEQVGWGLHPAEFHGGSAVANLTSLPSAVFVAPSAPVEEVVVVPPTPPADVLFVIDNSDSMGDEQQAFVNGLAAFTANLVASGVDFRAGVTTSDTNGSNPEQGLLRSADDGGTMVSFVDSSTLMPAAVLSELATVGTSGPSEQSGRDAAYRVLESNRLAAANAGFVREDADLYLVFVSDKDDSSVTLSSNDFRSWMQSAKVAPYDVKSHAIVGRPGAGCATVIEPGGGFIEYVNWTGGVVFDICNADLTNTMNWVGETISHPIVSMALSSLPDAGEPVVITIEDASGGVRTLDPMWYTVGNDGILLSMPIEPTETVRVAYTPGAVP